MTTQDIIAFKDFILSKNEYFANGYADAFKMPEDNRIMIYDKKGFKSIFPDDTKGDYFYIRSDAGVNFNLQDAQRLADHSPARYVFLDSATYYLVAFVKDADRYKLIDNLRNTCAMYTDMYIIPTAALWVNESVAVNELEGRDEADILNVLKKLSGYTLVRLTLSVNKNYTSSSCINNSCKNC